MSSPAVPEFDGKAFVSGLSLAPGVYRMYAADGSLLYVGKAGALKRRVASYFSNTPKTAYHAGFLRTFAAMPPGVLERVESLEQLRVLEAGHRIAVALTPEPFPPGVDTQEDLERAEARLRELGA